MEITLKTGFKTEATTYTTVELRTLTVGDVVDANVAAEKTQLSINGDPIVIPSPTLATAERLRRQVAGVTSEDGKRINGPIPMALLRKLDEQDYYTLLEAAQNLDRAYLEREAGEDGGGRAGAGGTPDGDGAEPA